MYTAVHFASRGTVMPSASTSKVAPERCPPAPVLTMRRSGAGSARRIGRIEEDVIPEEQWKG